MYQLNDHGVLIIPITRIAFGEAIIGHIRLYAKTEQHITVFNYPIGRMLLPYKTTDPAIIESIEGIVNVTDWSFTRTGCYYLLERSERSSRIGDFHTLVELINVPSLHGFYKAVIRELPQNGNPALIDALLRESAPHITLYTSDPEGKMGIGINSYFELVNAIKDTNATGESRSKILAYLLPRRVVEGTVIEVG